MQAKEILKGKFKNMDWQVSGRKYDSLYVGPIPILNIILKWDSKKEIIYTASPIMLTTEKNDTLYGNGFESDVGLNHWKILYPSGVTN